MNLIAFLTELVFPTPRICPLCYRKQVRLTICENCREKIEKIRNELGQCSRCGTFGRNSSICDNCRDWPQYLKANYASVPYQKEYREVIHALKFRKQGWLAKALVELMANLTTGENYDLIIPVPLHKNRFRERGFNQSAHLAKILAKNLGINYNHRLLVRKLDTPHQTGLTRVQRSSNLIGAFTVNQDNQIKNKHLLLVDDVITSGTTLHECAKTLHQAGAKKITCITWAAGVV